MKIGSNSNSIKKEKCQEKGKIDDFIEKYLDVDKNFEDLFPNLADEMKLDESTLPINGIHWKVEMDEDFEEKNELKNPDVISFIRRCKNKEEAIEIIDYMLRRSEITEEYANELKDQLKTDGLSSFGFKKLPGYYENKFRI